MLQARLGVQIEDYRILADLKTWTDVPAAVSPFHPVTAPGTSAFYRLKK